MRQSLPALLLVLAGLSLAHSVRAAEKVDCDNALTDADMQTCAYQDLERADHKLNAVYTRIIAQLNKDLNSPNEDTRTDAAERKRRLVASQRAWIGFRDADGELAGIKALGGTLERLEVPNQKRSLTIERTKELLDLFSDDKE